MAAFKCRMCGGALEFETGATVAECPFCGVKQTLPKLDDDRRANVFRRADHFRWQNEYDKAVAAYERLLEEDDSDAEAHWGVVLSRYGIEYVEDPASHERIPTCHRVQSASILTDADYLAAKKYARDGESAQLYEHEANRIAEIQRDILAISGREAPCDVFICYKETDESGARTKDSAIAQDVYYQLTNAGYRVFFSRITLEDKLGRQYEPYIFAALNSAKVMLVIGTKPEYFNAVWVKNEWSRYLALMKKDRSRLLIPCYRDMDAYDLPDELSMLQSQDMGRIGFIQDLLHGVEKVLKKEAPAAESVRAEEPAATVSGNITALVKRGYMSLEDGEWQKAEDFFEQALNQDAELSEAYLGLFLAGAKKSSMAKCVEVERLRLMKGVEEKQVSVPTSGEWTAHAQEMSRTLAIPPLLSEAEVAAVYELNQSYPSRTEALRRAVVQAEGLLSKNRNLARAVSFSRDPESIRGPWCALSADLKGLLEQSLAADAEHERRLADEARRIRDEKDEQAQALHRDVLERKERREADEREREEHRQQALLERTERRYTEACRLAGIRKTSCQASALLEFRGLNGYKDSARRADECERAITKLKKRKRTTVSLIVSLIALLVAAVLVLELVVLPANHLKAAQAAMAAGDYALAVREASLSRGDEAAALRESAFLQLGSQAAADGLYDVAAEYFGCAGDATETNALENRYTLLSLAGSADYAMPWGDGTYLLVNEERSYGGEVRNTDYYRLDPAANEVRHLTADEWTQAMAVWTQAAEDELFVAEELPTIIDAEPGFTLITADGVSIHFPDWQQVGAGAYPSAKVAGNRLRENGAVAVRVNGLWGFIDGNGEWLAEPVYRSCEEFVAGYALLQRPDTQRMVNGEYTTVEGEWLVIDASGAVVLESNGEWSPYYSDFSEGWMLVEIGSMKGFINLQGELYGGMTWNCAEISNGCGIVSDSYSGHSTVIHFETGRQYTVKASYNDIYPDPENGVFLISPYKSSHYVVNLAGTVISPKVKPNSDGAFSCIFHVSDDGRLVTVRTEDQYGVFELTGPVTARRMRTIAAAEWESISVPFTDTWESVMADHCGIFRVESTGYSGKFGYISLDGTLVSPVQWNDAGEFTPDGVAFVKTEGLWAMIDTTGSFIVEPTWATEPEYDAETGMYFVNVNGKWRMIDTAGNYVSEGAWDLKPVFSEGLAAVSVDGRWGYIDSSGAYVAEPVWDLNPVFSEGLAAVSVDGKWGYIDSSGATVIDFRYDEAGGFVNGVALVREWTAHETRYSLIDRSGNPLFDQSWNYAVPVNRTTDEYLVKTYMKYEVIDETGLPRTETITVLHIVDTEGNILW